VPAVLSILIARVLIFFCTPSSSERHTQHNTTQHAIQHEIKHKQAAAAAAAAEEEEEEGESLTFAMSKVL
jgi:hypothetical protein